MAFGLELPTPVLKLGQLHPLPPLPLFSSFSGLFSVAMVLSQKGLKGLGDLGLGVGQERRHALYASVSSANRSAPDIPAPVHTASQASGQTSG
mmetsp:Transcript_4045/g.9433  ORF Transcript_4045/g.9433 Transcript_4045/m.9433 type:complete len:93 (-) Transcript_4045:150-428(-)